MFRAAIVDLIDGWAAGRRMKGGYIAIRTTSLSTLSFKLPLSLSLSISTLHPAVFVVLLYRKDCGLHFGLLHTTV